jgi:hypothetical protein
MLPDLMLFFILLRYAKGRILAAVKGIIMWTKVNNGSKCSSTGISLPSLLINNFS